MPGDSIFDKIVVHENDYTQLFCNLMERNAEFRSAMLTRLFSREVADKIDANPIQTQETLKTDGRSHGRPDIYINTPQVCAIVEVKSDLGCSTTEQQRWSFSQEVEATGYARYLEQQMAAERWFVFLIPRGWIHQEELKHHLTQPRLAGSVHFNMVTWEDLFCTIDESMRLDPFIGEFRLLLSKRFEPIRIEKSEVNMLLNPEVINAVWKLNRIIKLIFQKAKNAGYAVEWETSLQEGSYGFYFKKGNAYLLYFGCWIAFSQKVRHLLCIGVADGWGEAVKKRFTDSSPYETITFADPKPHTMSWVPEEDLGDNDAAGKIWESIQPIVLGIAPPNA